MTSRLKPRGFAGAPPGLGREQPEAHEQALVVQYLESIDAAFCAVPNAGKRTGIEGALAKSQGLVAGAPDLLIFSRPWFHPPSTAMMCRFNVHFFPDLAGQRPAGVALEMKRPGAKRSSVSVAQEKFADRLSELGWYWFAAAGADSAIAELKRIGIR